jgi:hypothetical protein
VIQNSFALINEEVLKNIALENVITKKRKEDITKNMEKEKI